MLFNDINISGERLEGEDEKLYKVRRTIINHLLKMYLKNGNDTTYCYKRGRKVTEKPITVKEIKEIFDMEGVKI